MSEEYYVIEWKDKQVHMTPATMPKELRMDNGMPPAPWAILTCLGSQADIWCAVFRKPEGSGGFFVLQEYETPLLTAYAESNMAFAQGMKMFAEMTSNIKYAIDIFLDEGEEDEEA